MGTEGTIWEKRSSGTECNCGCLIHVAGDVNHSQEVCAVGQQWWPIGWHRVDMDFVFILPDANMGIDQMCKINVNFLKFPMKLYSSG